jgi:phosphoglycolate phosphatase-like HAD superfamily hydrolase
MLDHLVLFDIDGTLLLTSDPIYGEALAETVWEVYGLEVSPASLRRVDHPGETAMSGLRLLLRVEGLGDDEIDRGLERWCRLHGERYVELLADASTDHWERAPRAAETLEELERSTQIALLTGNPEPMARARMERLGLARFFSEGQGAFGCDAEERAVLIGIARERAGARPADQTVLVGDTPKDIAGAQAAGIAVIGVTTGRFGRGELAGADVVMDELAELPDALRRLGDSA